MANNASAIEIRGQSTREHNICDAFSPTDNNFDNENPSQDASGKASIIHRISDTILCVPICSQSSKQCLEKFEIRIQTPLGNRSSGQSISKDSACNILSIRLSHKPSGVQLAKSHL